MKIIILIFALVLLIVGCSNDNVINQSEDMDRKIGQMLLIGFRGFEVFQDSSIAKDIKAGRIGGVILFDKDVKLNSTERNIKSPAQVKDLITQLKSYSAIPLFISVDQEGGMVARLKEKYGFPRNVSEKYLGTLNIEDSTAFYGALTAQTLYDAGFNLNFAPVVDLNINPDNPVIGKIERSFSADPEVVVRNSKILINEFHKKNIYGALKHFPGHGSSTADSHLGLTDVTNTWNEIELKPYKQLINEGFNDIVMTAHIFNSKIDADFPATLSYKTITGILRNQLGYQGVVISDDMNMKAISDYYGLESAIELSINAGVDILVFANNLTYDPEISIKAIQIIKDLISSGRISKTRIDESYNRIMKLKNKIL